MRPFFLFCGLDAKLHPVLEYVILLVQFVLLPMLRESRTR